MVESLTGGFTEAAIEVVVAKAEEEYTLEEQTCWKHQKSAKWERTECQGDTDHRGRNLFMVGPRRGQPQY